MQGNNNTKRCNKKSEMAPKDEVNNVSSTVAVTTASATVDTDYGNEMNENMVDFGKTSSIDGHHQHDRHCHYIGSKKS